MRDLEPWVGGHPHLYQLHMLDIADKHDDLLVADCKSPGLRMFVRSPFAPEGSEPVLSFDVNAADPVFPIVDGSVLLTSEPGAKTAPESDLAPTFFVSFGPVTVAAGEATFPLSDNLVHAAREAVNEVIAAHDRATS